MDANRKVLLTAIQNERGVDPGTGYAGLLMEADSSSKLYAKEVERNVARAHRGRLGHQNAQKGWDFTWSHALKGGGVDGSGDLLPMECDHLLRASAYARNDGLVVSVSALTGTPEVGEEVTDTTQSGVVGKVLDVVFSGTTGTVYFETYTTLPADADALTFGTSGATATVSGAPAKAHVYAPVHDTSAQEFITCHWFRDGSKRVSTDVMCDWELSADVDGFPLLNFNAMGLYQRPSAAPLPTDVTYSATQAQLCTGLGLQLSDLDMGLTTVKTLQVKAGNQVTRMTDINAEDGVSRIAVLGNANITGSVDPEAVPLDTWNPWTEWENGTEARLYATFGREAPGERVRLLLPNVQYQTFEEGEREQSLIYQLPFAANGQGPSVAGRNSLYFIVY